MHTPRPDLSHTPHSHPRSKRIPLRVLSIVIGLEVSRLGRVWLGRGGGGGQGASKGLRVFRTLVSDCTGGLNETAVGRCFQTVEGLFRCGERPLERPDFRISMTTVKSYQHIFPLTVRRVLVEYRLTGKACICASPGRRDHRRGWEVCSSRDRELW